MSEKRAAIPPSGRRKALADEQHRKMAASAHAYVRGSTVRFYQWLEASDRCVLPEGPGVWICGDCHVGNLGPVASVAGKLAIQIRDLDQTVIGNPAHDLVRLGLSLAMAARGSDLPGVTTARMLERMIEGYEAAFAPDELGETQDTTEEMPKTVRRVMRVAASRSWKHLADERIEGLEPVIPLGRWFWPLTPEEREAAALLFAQPDLRKLVTSLRGREDDAEVRLLDAAYWRKGCSSLGLFRMAALLAVGFGKAERHCLVDVKEAVKAAAPRKATATMPQDQAVRVVAGASSLSPFLGGRMVAAHMLGISVFVRELLPQDLKLELKSLTRDEAVEVAEFLAHVVGCGHARQMDAAERRTWLAELGRSRSKSLDAPSWLWNSVVELVSLHEAAYLEHCRRWALMTPIIRRRRKKRQPLDQLAPPSDATSLVFMPTKASRGVHAIKERQDMPNDLVTALKSLHTDAIDAGNSYEEALKDAEGHGLTSLFQDMIALHGKHADELLSLIRSLRENASDEGSFMSNVHRTIITIRSLFGGLNESILPGLIDGEKRNVSYYDDALNKQTLPESANALLLRQRDELRSAVGRMQADQP